MQKLASFSVVFLFCVFCIGVSSIAEEITLTTYYPAPYGAYEELYVSENLGVGTDEPDKKLHIKFDGNDGALIETTGDNASAQLRLDAPGEQSRVLIAIGNDTARIQTGKTLTNVTPLSILAGEITFGPRDKMTISPEGDVVISGDVRATSYSVGENQGVTDTFTVTGGRVVTVTNGIITNISGQGGGGGGEDDDRRGGGGGHREEE